MLLFLKLRLYSKAEELTVKKDYVSETSRIISPCVTHFRLPDGLQEQAPRQSVRVQG